MAYKHLLIVKGKYECGAKSVTLLKKKKKELIVLLRKNRLCVKKRIYSSC